MTDRRKLDPLSDRRRINCPPQLWDTKLAQVHESLRPSLERYIEHYDEAAREGIGWLLVGDAGVGKTAAATILLRNARSLGYTAYFTTVWSLCDEMRKKGMFDLDTSVLERCVEVDCLVLDDLRAEDLSNFTLGKRGLEGLIVERRDRGRVTIVTSRIDPETLKQLAPDLVATMSGCMLSCLLEGEDRHKNRMAFLTEGEE